MTTTAKGIPELSASAFIKDGPTDINAALTAIDALFDAFVPAGTMFATGCSSAPTGFLLCDGSAVSRTTYATLFTAISTTYGTGNGSTTFNLPDLRGRVPVGVDGAAARLAANDALGNSSGAETHTLTSAQMPAHTHDVVWGTSGGTGPGIRLLGSASQTAQIPNLPDAIVSTGGGGAHNNMQPYQIVNWMIKT